MANISRDQIQVILQNAPQGSNPRSVLDELVSRGHTIEGVDMEGARTRVVEQLSPEVSKKAPFRERAGDVLNTFFGGGKIGEAIGTGIAKYRAPEEQKQFIKGPSLKEVAGDVARVGSTFFPVGRLAGAATKVAKSLGLMKGTKAVGEIAAGGTAGAAIDISEDVAADRDVGLGYGTVFGAGIPAAAPVAAALSRVTTRLAGKFGSEISGALTGTSAETVEQAFHAAKTGGRELDEFTKALRGRTTPERLAMQLKDNAEVINKQRQTLFKETLTELGDEVVETGDAKAALQTFLDEAKIMVRDNGTLDFTNAGKLKLVPQAQTKIQQAFSEVQNLPTQISLEELDDARQAIKALSLTGDDPSAKLGNKLIDDAVRSVREAGEQVDGYGQMLDEFGETSQFLEELQKGLAASDQRTIDQTYRRMATALKTNNEQRMALIRELDHATDGAILSSIAGQQLSETLPRGIFRQIAAGIAGGAALTGGMTQSLIPALVFASPRVTGEFVRTLGLTAQKASSVIGAIDQARGLLIKIGAISGAVMEPGDNK